MYRYMSKHNFDTDTLAMQDVMVHAIIHFYNIVDDVGLGEGLLYILCSLLHVAYFQTVFRWHERRRLTSAA